jgi:hypothetical protein
MLQYAAGVLPDIPPGIYGTTIQPPLDCGCMARADSLVNPTAVVFHTDRSPGGPIPSWNDRRFHTGRSPPLAVAAKVSFPAHLARAE